MLSELELSILYSELTDGEIGMKFKISESTIRRWRRAYGIQSRSTGKRKVPQYKSKVTDKELMSAAVQAGSIAEIARMVGLCDAGSGHRSIKRRLASLDIVPSGKRKRSFIGFAAMDVPIDEFISGQREVRSFTSFKRRLLKLGFLKEICAECGTGNIWNGKQLALQLHHVDGNKDNNLIENLQLLCPNCHSQTISWTGRNKNSVTAPR